MGEWDLKLPGGIDDDRSRALLRLLNARFDAIPVERVLVWHLATVVSDALPYLAESLGMDRLSFVGGPPRDFLKSAIALARRFGTEAALGEALVGLGYSLGNVSLVEDTVLRRNGAIAHSGEPYRHGADAHWAVFFLWITAPAGLTTVKLLELWDVVWLVKPRRCHPVLIIEATAGRSVYRSRAAIA